MEALLKPALFTSKGVAFSTNQQRPLAENPAVAVAVGMVLRSPLMGVRALGGALGANQLCPSGSHPRHVPSGPSSISCPSPLGGLWRARVLSGERSCVQRLRASCAQQPGWEALGFGCRQEERPRPLRQALLGRSRARLPVHTAGAHSEGG